jgi:hypothetical protein
MKNVCVLFTIICVALGLAACGGGTTQPIAQDTTTVSLTVTQTGSASYSIDAANLNGINGFDLTLNYDAASLASPTIVQGSLVAGCLMFANTATAGSIRIAIISTKSISGGGQIATISFASQTGNGGMVSGTASMVDSTGKPVSATLTIQTSPSIIVPAPPPAAPPSAPTPVSPTPVSASSSAAGF